MARRMKRASKGQVASYIAAYEKGIAAELKRDLIRKVARGIQGFAIESMNELAQKGPAWTGEFSASWGFAPQGVKPWTPGTTGKIHVYNKNSVPVRDVERYLNDGITVFSISNTSEHAEIAIDQETAKFFRPSYHPKPIEEAQEQWEHGDAMPRPSMRFQIGGSVDESDPGANSSRTAPADWFITYVVGGGLQKDLNVGFSRDFKDKF